MSFQILLNFIIAFMWMFLNHSLSGVTFIIGYILGIFILFVLRRFFSERFYMSRVYSIMKLLLLFMRELVKSNIIVVRDILRPKLNIQPCIFALPITVKKDWEITILANLITLTPGTLVMDISDDNSILYIHAMNVNDVDEAIDDIKNTFEKAIMEVSRG